MTWHSPTSFWTDMVFGLLPAILFVFMSLYALVVAVIFSSQDPWNSQIFGLYALAVPGTISSLSLVYTTLARARARFKPWLQASLLAGLGCTAYLVYFLIFQIGFQNSLLIFLVPAVSIAVIACKHIVLLARAEGVSR